MFFEEYGAFKNKPVRDDLHCALLSMPSAYIKLSLKSVKVELTINNIFMQTGIR